MTLMLFPVADCSCRYLVTLEAVKVTREIGPSVARFHIKSKDETRFRGCSTKC
jgi:hypothetical protein